MTQPAQFYSATWDPKFLELPHDRMLLAKFDKVPTRPTAHVLLQFDPDDNRVVVRVMEEGVQKMETVAARYDGDKLELRSPKYNAVTKKSEDFWRAWDYQYDGKPPRFQSELEALCWMTLVCSDVGCPNQARSDMPQAMRSTLWSKLWSEIKKLHPVASVMLT
jgi:hypothetical protein